MYRFRSLTLTVLLTGVLAAGAYAQGPGPDGGGRGPGPGFGRGGGLPLRALNLTDAQREQVGTLTQQYRDQQRAAGEKLRAAFAAQRKAVQTIPVNEGLIRSTTQALAEAQTAAALLRARVRSELFALLTPEQQAEATRLQADREARAQQRGQQRRNRR